MAISQKYLTLSCGKMEAISDLGVKCRPGSLNLYNSEKYYSIGAIVVTFDIQIQLTNTRKTTAF